jgi:nucleoside-diphosphate-sugar epimerase
MSTALVTGGNVYLGTWLIADLLRRGTAVRAVLRSLESEATLRDGLQRGRADDAGLESVVASLTADDGWTSALGGVEEVYHLASPMHYGVDPEQIVAPARDGALRLLRAAREAGARRVVMTSSFAAIGYSPKPVRDYTEDDWTNPDTPGLPPYPLSKTVAELACWDFIEREGGETELVVINPTFIAGPTLTSELRSSLNFFKALIDGTMTVVPRQRFGVADVRDVAELHIAAMATQEAAGKRYLALADGPTTTYLAVAQLLRDRLGALAERVTLDEAPGDELPPLTIHNDRAKQELGFRPRAAETTLVETVESMRDLGLLDMQE